MKPVFFKSGDEFRTWLEKYHGSESEIWLGFYKKSSGKGGITYAEAVDEALCFGWIDGRVQRIDELRHRQRYTPRTARSIWSQINIKKAEALIASGRMTAMGLKVYRERDPARAKLYSFEQDKTPTLSAEYLKRLKANKKAWGFFSEQAAGYRKVSSHWVMSAKKEETRERRMSALIKDSAANRKLRHLDPKGR